MKKLLSIVSAASLAVLSLSALPAHADGTNLHDFFDESVHMTISPYASGENNGTYYVGLTTVTISNVLHGPTSFQAFCDDFAHQIIVPSTYTAYLVPITTDVMKQEAYYGMMMGKNATLDTELQELIWNYTAPANEQFAMNDDMKHLQQEMLDYYKTIDYWNSWYLDAKGNGQSFMVVSSPVTIAPTPEPPTLITLATGLFGIAGFIRRRIRGAAADTEAEAQV